ncbi:MAG: hypothetical protein AAF604_00185 [Acidobacteriota bacterium]
MKLKILIALALISALSSPTLLAAPSQAAVEAPKHQARDAWLDFSWVRSLVLQFSAEGQDNRPQRPRNNQQDGPQDRRGQLDPGGRQG